MDAVIYNITDLREEIARLKAVKTIQEQAIASHFNSPAAIFHTVTSFFKSSGPAGKSAGGILGSGQDIVSLISRFALPFILNKTIFRGSNFIIKTIVGLLSQQASGFINEKSVGTLWDKLKTNVPNIVTNILHKKDVKKKQVDYGIPPDSETY